MASGVLPAENGGTLESFDSSEFSLISEPPQEEVGLCYSTNSTALQADLMSARLDLSEDEIQRKLFELTEDNKLLKEALQQSGSRMRSELSSIADWHNNITTNMAALQVTLQEAQARIQELEQEKEELMRRNKEGEGQINTMQNMYEESEIEKTNLKSKLVNLEELKARNNELSLNHAVEYQEKTNAMQAEHGRITAELQEQIKSLEEKLRVNDELMLNHANEYQEKTNALQSEHGRLTAKLQEQIKSLEEKQSSETRTVETDHVFTNGHDESQGLASIRMKPDDRGRFGLTVQGGAGLNFPILVSKVAPNTPADTCIPRLNEGDQVLMINGRDVSGLKHDQVVKLIRASREQHPAELLLTVRKNVISNVDDNFFHRRVQNTLLWIANKN